MTDIVASIWDAALAACPVTDTAEQRVAFDNVLRARLAAISDRDLRAMAGEMIRQRRWALFTPSVCYACGQPMPKQSPG